MYVPYSLRLSTKLMPSGEIDAGDEDAGAGTETGWSGAETVHPMVF